MFIGDNICSLLPNKDRYAFSIIFRINNYGEIMDYRFVKTIIHSKKAFSYQEADDLIQKDDDEDKDCQDERRRESDISKINKLTDLIYRNNNFHYKKVTVKADL